MPFGLIVIGDEILSGKRQDRHFARVREILAARGLRLAWAGYLGDDPARIAETLARTFAGDDIVFSTGGIGATPDDHTRAAAAQALGVPLLLHPEASELIAGRMRELGLPLNRERLAMGEFPHGAEIVPNPFNRIPGFSLRRHYFVPGFPAMAWPMIEWVLDTHYAHLFGSGIEAERALTACGLSEAALTPLMAEIEAKWPGVKVFSLPHMDEATRLAYRIELGVKGDAAQIEAAFARLREGASSLGAKLQEDASGELEPPAGPA